jgi:riboflavin synthase
MFSGITQGTAPVVAVHRQPLLLSYEVELPEHLVGGLQLGASVAVDGVCQTVVALEHRRAKFEAIEETLRRTTLDQLQRGDRVSVERSLRMGDEIGGHLVTGHVIGTGLVSGIEVEQQRYVLSISVPQGWVKYIQPKGFIALDGSSLTVVEVTPEVPMPAGADPKQDGSALWGQFTVHLIPETLRLTNLESKRPGSRINIELEHQTVAIVDAVERVLVERFA